MANKRASTLLKNARQALYDIAGGGIDSDDVGAAHLTTAQRTRYFRSRVFRSWVRAERAEGRQVFWLKDLDKTQGAGDIFTFFYHWRVCHKKFMPEQLDVIRAFLSARLGSAYPAGERTPEQVLRLWQSKEAGGEGISLLDFWSGVYWPSQVGLTAEEKRQQVRDFCPHYAVKIYPGVPEENLALQQAGVEVVIVSYGDQELARAVAPLLAVKPENVVGSRLKYGKDGRATGVNHTYELFDNDWSARPQPGKPLFFHYFVHENRQRFNWKHISDERIVIGGRDGDSASSDGGMMVLMKPAAIGNFMVNTPDEPERLEKFRKLAAKYGWTRGAFIALDQERSLSGSQIE